MTTHDAGGRRDRGIGRPALPTGSQGAAVEQQHGDDDDAEDDLPNAFRRHLEAQVGQHVLRLDHRQDRLQQRDQDHSGDRAEIGAPAAQDGVPPSTTAAIDGSR